MTKYLDNSVDELIEIIDNEVKLARYIEDNLIKRNMDCSGNDDLRMASY